MHRELRSVQLTNFFFDGGKAELAKGLSPNFQVSHSFTFGGGSASQPSAYHFGALYATEQLLLHGMLGTDGVLHGKAHWIPNKQLSFRAQHQISNTRTPHSAASQSDMLQVEADYVGPDYSVNAKAFNPVGGSGIFTVGFLQSVAKGVAIGAEAFFQQPPVAHSLPDVAFTLHSKVFGENFSFCASLQQASLLQASYWRRVGGRVEVGSELHASLFGKRDAVTTIGCRIDFRQALLRAQLETTGKVSLVLEEKLAPGFSLLLCGEIDHLRDASKFGLGINMES